MTATQTLPLLTSATAPNHAGGLFRVAWVCGAMLFVTIGCTREVETGNPPVVIALADVVESSRPVSNKTQDAEESTAASSAAPEVPEPPFDPTALLEETPSHERCVAALLPSAEEDRWLETDWRTDLLQARREANATGRPMFMWLMDGNPLGCT